MEPMRIERHRWASREAESERDRTSQHETKAGALGWMTLRSPAGRDSRADDARQNYARLQKRCAILHFTLLRCLARTLFQLPRCRLLVFAHLVSFADRVD